MTGFLRSILCSTGNFATFGQASAFSLSQILKTIDDPSVEIVSFDVYDTLLVRPVIEPADLFFLTALKLQKQRLSGDFIASRKEAERLARRRMREQDPLREEPTLDAIYEALAEITGLSAREVAGIKTVELDNERRSLSGRKLIREIYEHARQKGKRLIAVSDSYASRDFIWSVLQEEGFQAIERVYVSSEFGRCKASGKLYSIVLEDLNIVGSKMLHLGDNLHSDVKRAQDAGIRAAYIPSAVYTYFALRDFAKLWAQIGDDLPMESRLLLGMIINTCFDRPDKRQWKQGTLFNDDDHAFGYGYLGPILLLAQSTKCHSEIAPVGQWVQATDDTDADTPAFVRMKNSANKFLADAEALLGDRLKNSLNFRNLCDILFRTVVHVHSASDKALLGALPAINPSIKASVPVTLLPFCRRMELIALRPLLGTREYARLIVSRSSFFASTQNPAFKFYHRLHAKCRAG
ncbi:HAD family hydrolase [Neorhizobium sp. Rsf11]|uniref:HAD family hydrolase n=1 Tax=Neorhizobium phenanthreniclasticum TaxID=3157917 RepID=A0ABV0M656_9HYPH